ncbi:2-oxo-4-hydroxy-4-carboxy-5-ureidoimidazoline decarboxylase [Pseudoalteromonas sp. NZS100_1]|uniref:2-oxo-4-hydroxy-4-carboxy-5-ureidoimidazoline decarboxylase n=1 Tax=Pseudoalteromonas sp. NZS100_1 TaxID=2792073 RepID=UPI0018CF18DB|nr:2-oxo-4-hydroxy-4-carboxy-5-ureidoimidazoline decarboxylase [Pseudoalteromonas sp. NZS100_1]MBH0014135.1 2-oxo-4-hydroxy-4-carboxy-5-ureidoimidazoline decarboxylase [Pseudoalteromonas sp. NZS100_1]
MSSLKINNLNEAQAHQALEHCCAAPSWVSGMLNIRPFKNQQHLFESAQSVWNSLNESDYLAAFEGHPQIGDLSTLSKKYAATAQKAGHEQSGMSKANEAVLTKMIALNKEYLNKFGFIFIVCASGKTAEQMLELIEQRMHNTRSTELNIAAGEQAKITKIRLESLL